MSYGIVMLYKQGRELPQTVVQAVHCTTPLVLCMKGSCAVATIATSEKSKIKMY